MRLGRMLAALAPDEPEVHGLVALMEIQASRIPARTGQDGAMITLLDQDRGRWDRLLITHGLASLARAAALSGSEVSGPYVLQAALAACHARAAHRRGHGLDAHRGPVPDARLAQPVPGGRAQPRRRGRDG